MVDEVRTYFWSSTLDSNKLKDVWDPDKNLGLHGDALKGEHRLSVKKIMVGTEMRNGEENVVERETIGYKKQLMKFPVTIVQGESKQMTLNFFFPNPPVTFNLVRGMGPVYLLGNHSVRMEEVEEDIVCRATDVLGQEVKFVVIDEDSEEQEGTSDMNRRDNNCNSSQSNISKIRKRARGD